MLLLLEGIVLVCCLTTLGWACSLTSTPCVSSNYCYSRGHHRTQTFLYVSLLI